MSVRIHRRVFFAAYGPGPWPCYLSDCGKLVQCDDLTVHHINEDRTDNAPENLAAMHHACHSSLHHSGKEVSPETRVKIASSVRGMTHSAETRRKIGAASRNRKHEPLSDEHKRKISASKRGRKHSDESRRNMSEAATVAWTRRRTRSNS